MAIVLEEQAATTHERAPCEVEVLRQDVDRRVREMMVDPRRPRPLDALGEELEVVVLVAEQIAGAGAEQHADRASDRAAPSSRPLSSKASVAATTPICSLRDQRRRW